MTAAMPDASTTPELHGSARTVPAPMMGPSNVTLFVSRFWIVAVYVAVLVGLYQLQDLLWTVDAVPSTGWEKAWSVLFLVWILPAPVVLFGMVGLLAFVNDHRKDRRTVCLRPSDHQVVFRIVSRGTNREALGKTVDSVFTTMADYPNCRFEVETVTDVDPELPARPGLRCIVTPTDYQTPQRARFKARALHYAAYASPTTDGTWVVFLDEESHITRSAVEGIWAFVDEQTARDADGDRPKIGQGCIVYHRDLDEQTFLTLADTIRTGDDLGRFYLQHRLGLTLFGLHGSYIVCRNDLVRRIGFDFGDQGSITEDAFFALVAMEQGERCGWVDGIIEEQSTRSIPDFIKQRRRWFVGLLKVVRYAPVRRWWRVPLGISVGLWAISWMGQLITYLNFFVDPAIRYIGNACFAYYVTQYVLGLRVNLDHYGETNVLRRLRLYVSLLVLLPVFSILEAAGVVYGLVKPETGFHVVKK
jgi:egghead protein (zeste-white 4 protein)